MDNKEIIMYQTEDGKVSFDVNLENETVWLTQMQMSELFEKDRTVITRHINNIFKEEELERKSNVQKMHFANSDKPVSLYSLDVIISVGYRVKSKRGTQFRIWANSVLKEYLIKGYALNENKFEKEKLKKLIDLIKIAEKTINNQVNNLEEAKGLLKVISDYTYALTILDEYDHQEVKIRNTTKKEAYVLDYEEAMTVIKSMKDEFASDLFGNEKDESFKGSLGAIYQTAFGEDVYPSYRRKGGKSFIFCCKKPLVY